MGLFIAPSLEDIEIEKLVLYGDVEKWLKRAKIGKFLEVTENTQETETIILYGCDGEVYSIDDFLKNNLDSLPLLDHKIAEEILKAGIFKERKEYRDLKSMPLTLSKDFGKKPVLKAERKEGRLAYWRDIKFKGCNPVSKKKSYYNLTYRFGQEMPEIIASTWGVMELQEALKEILATGFLILRDKPNALFPLYQKFTNS